MLISRFKKRIPSVELITKFFRPTKCAVCYWWRLSLVALACYAMSFIVNDLIFVFALLLFFVGGYYSLKEADSE